MSNIFSNFVVAAAILTLLGVQSGAAQVTPSGEQVLPGYRRGERAQCRPDPERENFHRMLSRPCGGTGLCSSRET